LISKTTTEGRREESLTARGEEKFPKNKLSNKRQI